MDVRIRWKEKLATVNVDVYNAIKCYESKNDCIESDTMRYLDTVWKARQASELSRVWWLPNMWHQSPSTNL